MYMSFISLWLMLFVFPYGVKYTYLILSYLILAYLILSYLISSHLISSHIISSHLISSISKCSKASGWPLLWNMYLQHRFKGSLRRLKNASLIAIKIYIKSWSTFISSETNHRITLFHRLVTPYGHTDLVQLILHSDIPGTSHKNTG